ncbi:MAG: pyridoxamine 5'-phosphate oxidase family protein [SAR324 cluster bacterium]|nr:pyridoxamine 5'-phosphate oxidase family protein [SAR324 cluster bacterium]
MTELLNPFQKEFGPPSKQAAGKIRNDLGSWAQRFIRQSSFLVMATSDTEGKCDASPKGGKPGFVKIIDEKHLILPDIAGNRLFQSYANIQSNPHVGLVFFIPGVDGTVRVNGTARRFSREDIAKENIEMEIFDPDEEAKILQGLYITVEESYSHCPRSSIFSRVWDPEVIVRHKSDPPIEKWKPGA